MRCIDYAVVMAGVLVACEPSTSPTGGPQSPNPTTSTSASVNPTSPKPAVEPPDAGEAAIKTLHVREVLADCEGEGPMKCMQVRESDTGEWNLFYGAIEGFTYEEGHAYVLRVKVDA